MAKASVPRSALERVKGIDWTDPLRRDAFYAAAVSAYEIHKSLQACS